MQGNRAIAEIQFADYIFPAFDQACLLFHSELLYPLVLLFPYFFEKTQKTFAFHFIGKREFVTILLRESFLFPYALQTPLNSFYVDCIIWSILVAGSTLPACCRRVLELLFLIEILFLQEFAMLYLNYGLWIDPVVQPF